MIEWILIACVLLVMVSIVINEVLVALESREHWLRQEYFASREYWARISDIAGVPMREKDDRDGGQ